MTSNHTYWPSQTDTHDYTYVIIAVTIVAALFCCGVAYILYMRFKDTRRSRRNVTNVTFEQSSQSLTRNPDTSTRKTSNLLSNNTRSTEKQTDRVAHRTPDAHRFHKCEHIAEENELTDEMHLTTPPPTYEMYQMTLSGNEVKDSPHQMTLSGNEVKDLPHMASHSTLSPKNKLKHSSHANGPDTTGQNVENFQSRTASNSSKNTNINETTSLLSLQPPSYEFAIS